MFDTKTLQKQIIETHDRLAKDLATIQTGQASLALLDNIHVDSYGVMTPLNQVANIGISDPKTILISPWDKGAVRAIEKALMLADLGVGIVADGEGVRVIIPEMTTDRRLEIAKTADKKMEEAKIRVRQVREDTMNEIKKLELSDDEKMTIQNEVQDIIKKANNDIESAAAIKKEKIING